MTYKELVAEWHKSREQSMEYKFEVGHAFSIIYQNIAKLLGYNNGDRLNDYMKLYPISEVNEEKMKTSSYSLYGAITYEKFGWSSILLQINTNETEYITPNGIYRFVFYIKKIDEYWYFYIDEEPYVEDIVNKQLTFKQKPLDSVICSNNKDYINIATEKVFNSITSKISWNENYINNLKLKIQNIKQLFINKLETNDDVLKYHSDLENIKSELGYLSYELNDWTNFSFSLLLELNKNTYPKTDYIFTFHLTKKDNNWYIKLAQEKEEIIINTDDEINVMLDLFCTYQDTFNRWLTCGEQK